MPRSREKFTYVKDDPYIQPLMYRDINNAPLFQKFQLLKSKWLQETRFHSNPEIIYSNKYYQEIIQLGTEVVPYIMDDLKNERNNWFQALAEILNADPIKPEHYGNFNAMINDWMIWSNQTQVVILSKG